MSKIHTRLNTIPHRTRFALISNSAFSISNFRLTLIKDLLAREIEVYALAPDHDANSRELLQNAGAICVDIQMDRSGINPWNAVRSIFDMRRVLRTIRADIVLSCFLKPTVYGSTAAFIAGVPRRYALVAGLGHAFCSDEKATSLKKRTLQIIMLSLFRIGFLACQKIIVQNQEDIDFLSAQGVLPLRKSVRVNGTGVDLESLKPGPVVRDPMTFLFAGRLLREKGVREFAAAAKIIKEEHPKTRFIILGGVDDNPSSIKLEEIEKWVSLGYIEWAGHVNNVAERIKKSSVFVLPSYYREGVPRSTQEAMALGRPIITTDNIGCRETVVHSKTGFMIPVRDTGALAEAMQRFIINPALLTPMGRASRELAEKRFDIRHINKTMLQAMDLLE